ncbi:hypothetical protein [Kitasatospora sp. MAP5-34]|uniref:hypothetical protein n=1 Tax=Kitasatospora sp. MAP5-34 TaxID=3035102 RepID=UPI00247C2AF3|nr:ABC-type uncharacterized transport system ATPase subunit [Kitasatospora sp. MAP5-34]
MISSELPEVLGLADRVLVMQNGRITGHLDHTQATEEAILALAMADDLTPSLPHETTTAPRTGTDPAPGGTR